MQEVPTRFSSAPPAADDYRTRLIMGLAHALAEKSYAETTIADIVRHTQVSKRTFYEHFPDKEACFLAAYNDLSNMLLASVVHAVENVGNAEGAIEASLRAYFGALAESAPIIRPFFTDVSAAGPAALKLRREIHQRYAEQMRSVSRARVAANLPGRLLSPDMAAALVGALNELVLLAIEEGRAAQLTERCETAIELLRAVYSWTP